MPPASLSALAVMIPGPDDRQKRREAVAQAEAGGRTTAVHTAAPPSGRCGVVASSRRRAR